MLRSLAASLLLTASAVAADLPRLDFAHPVEGETMRISIERARPGSVVHIGLADENKQPLGITWRVVTDGAGNARVDWPLERGAAGRGFWLIAQNDGVTIETRGVFQLPQLLVTGMSPTGESTFLRIPVAAGDDTFAASFPPVNLGSGTPGGAVRDARGTKTYVVSDRVRGTLRIVHDDPRLGAPSIDLPRDVRGIAITEDGRRIYVVAGGATPEQAGVLTIVDTSVDRIVDTLVLDALGDDGGRIVLTRDGHRAFVSVRGLYVREINVRRSQLGALVAVGEPGQERITDLRVVDGHVYALTSGKKAPTAASLTSVVVSNLRDAFQVRGLDGSAGMAVGADRAGRVLFVLDGSGGEVTVLDAETLARRRTFDVPAGAAALLLPPNEATDRGAVLYSDGLERSVARWFGADGIVDGPALELPIGTWAPPVFGSARLIDWMFVADAFDLLAFRSEDVDAVRIPLPMRAAVVSIGR
ncbi:MAG: hypothetical protein JNL94_00125 [Planctomycetes bacterium]|nr:hypothetical protein [Planctomycetota bacterium]